MEILAVRDRQAVYFCAHKKCLQFWGDDLQAKEAEMKVVAAKLSKCQTELATLKAQEKELKV